MEQTANSSEENREQRYEEIIHSLICKNGWSRRKARLAYASMQRKIVKQYIKKGQARQDALRKLDQLILPPEVTPEVTA